jgi:hypothetical protein
MSAVLSRCRFCLILLAIGCALAPDRVVRAQATADHRFSDNLAEFDGRLLEAIAWVRQNVAR